MTDAELVIIGKLIDICRAKRVKVLVNDGFRIELELPDAAANTKPEKPGVDPDLCRCKHPQHMHQNGLCLAGCKEEVCAGPEATA